MKASTWAVLALCVRRALPSGAAAGGDQCNVVCDTIKSETSSSEACAKARKSLPRPKIGRICQDAFEKALESTCVEACQRHGSSTVPESRLGEACDKRRREVPRPVAHKACVDGFNAGFAATTAFIAERVELAQNVEVPPLDEVTQGVFAGNAGSASSMGGMTVRGADESGAGEPPRGGRDKLEKYASSGEGDSTMMKLGSEYQEVLTAEHVIGFQGASTDKSIERSGKADSTTIKIGSEYQEVLKAEHVKGFGSASRDRSIERSGKADSTTTKIGSEFHEVLKAEHVKGFGSASRDRSIGNQARDESAILPGAANEKEVEGVSSSKENLSVELPKDGRFQEVLTADHIKGFQNPSSRDKPRSDRDRSDSVGGARQKEYVPASAAAELEDYVTLELPEPLLSTNAQTVEALSVKEVQPREMQEDELATLESEGND